MRILVLRGGALGDFLVTVPALRALGTRWPGAKIELIGNRRAAELAIGDGCLAQAYDQHEARWAPLYHHGPLPIDLLHWLRGFDRIVSYSPDPDGNVAAHLRTVGSPYVTSSALVSTSPAARHFLEPLASWGVTTEDYAPRLQGDPIADAAVEMTLPREPFIAIHPGSGSPRKTWPLVRWYALAEQLRWPVFWITGEADVAPPPPLATTPVHAKQWSLPRLLSALSRASLYLGHDTGISHLAAAAGARSVLLFGPTDPAIWAPPTPRAQVLRALTHRIGDLTLEAVFAAVQEALATEAPTRNATASRPIPGPRN